jgi:hypothetical protein
MNRAKRTARRGRSTPPEGAGVVDPIKSSEERSIQTP